jgi:His-Xaa-Ser system radical SAM maturase HxsC
VDWLMLKLHLKSTGVAEPLAIDKNLILVVTTNVHYNRPSRASAALLIDQYGPEIDTGGFGVVLVRHPHQPEYGVERIINIGEAFDFLADGDVVRVISDRTVSVIYRLNASINSLLVTERCNSFCVMCSQPPRDIDDSYLIDQWMRAIPLFSRSTREIGITGGEPTLLGDQLIRLLRQLKAYLPDTAVHMLSNGRNFKDIDVAKRLAAVRHPDIMLGVPLYSDIASIHDFVVQADGAFDETIRGLLNLRRCSIAIELRVVIHRVTYERLPALARFIVRNLQFVDKVALMGLEITGFTKSNLGELWIDPVEYQSQLKEAVAILSRGKVTTSIYNHQLCVLDKTLWPIAVKSISDWKNEYMPECTGCSVMNRCGGFFSSAHIKRSQHIAPIDVSAAQKD